MFGVTTEELCEHIQKAGDLEDRWKREKDGRGRWQVLRDVYAYYGPMIAQYPHGMNPYLVEWDFTPIEWHVWSDIRGGGLPFYPQYPVGRYFLDFGDPHKKIGLEADGRAFHDKAKDKKRDEDLSAQGWRIFRVAGYETLAAKHYPFDEGWWHRHTENPDAFRQEVEAWSLRWSEAVAWALRHVYYTEDPDKYEFIDIAYRCLNAHKLADFDLLREGLGE